MVNNQEIKLLDAFAGIGALHKSLKNLGLPIKIMALSEIDIDAIISYAAIHIKDFKNVYFDYPSDDQMRDWLIKRNIGYDFTKNKSKVPRLKQSKLKQVYKASVLLNNLGDISSLDPNELPDFDLFNFSFCCQDLSVAGKQKGMRNEDGTATRSGLYVYGINIIRTKKPKYIMIENVKNLIGKKFIGEFYNIIKEVEEIGYNCYYPINEKGNPVCLNAKDYGIPQNRERIFVICIRKDIDDRNFEFPKKFDNGVRLKDILENDSEEKYNLKTIKDFFIKNSFDMERKGNGFRFEPHVKNNAQIAKCITTRAGGRMDDNYVLDIKSKQDKFCFCSKNDEIENLIKNKDTVKELIKLNLDIRKLTPVECWRLMGFETEDCLKAREQGISDSQLYQQAGNSIVVNVLYYIFKNLLKDYIK